MKSKTGSELKDKLLFLIVHSSSFNTFFLFIYLFWLCWVLIAAHGLSLVAASGGCFLLQCAGFSLWWLPLLWSRGSRCVGFSSCSTQAQQLQHTDCRAQAQQLWCMGLVALWHEGSSRTRDRTRVPCIGRWILNHCATREVPFFSVFITVSIILGGWYKRGRLVKVAPEV